MMILQRGQKLKLAEITSSQNLHVGLSVDYRGGGSVDYTCFGLDLIGKLSDDKYMIFYNQTASPERSIVIGNASSPDQCRFEIDLAKVPSKITRLVFTATIDGTGTMSQIQGGHLRIIVNNEEVSRFELKSSDYSQEKALIICEIYLKDVWRIAAVGQGFAGGLDALLTSFGGTLASSAPPSTPNPASSPAPTPTVQPKVNLGKVTLEKKGSSAKIDLRKGGFQPLHVNLNWDQNVSKKGGFFGLKTLQADLDLGCMYELRDGTKGVVQALGGNMGSKERAPWILLDKDDRTGSSSDGENLFVYKPSEIKRVLVFAYIYELSSGFNFTQLNALITIKDDSGNEITVRLDSPSSDRTFCAVCLITNMNEEIVITKEENYFPGHSQCDGKYGFGFRWSAGSK